MNRVCSFCKQTTEKDSLLIKSFIKLEVFICEYCLDLCNDILIKEEGDEVS